MDNAQGPRSRGVGQLLVVVGTLALLVRVAGAAPVRFLLPLLLLAAGIALLASERRGGGRREEE